jgi:hypothetical protein
MPTTRELRQRSQPRRGLGLQEAAIYVGCAERKFAKLVAKGIAPEPYLLDDQQRWDIKDLDDFIDRLPRKYGSGAGARRVPRPLPP